MRWLHIPLAALLFSAFAVAKSADEPLDALKARAENAKPQDQAHLFATIARREVNEADRFYTEGDLTNATKAVDAVVHYALGNALLHARDFPAAQQVLIETVKLKPDMGQAYGDLALAASENKQYELAIRALDARAKFLPETPGTYFLRATSYDNLEAFKQAAENYRQFLEVAQGKYPDQEWQARHRLIAIDPKNK